MKNLIRKIAKLDPISLRARDRLLILMKEKGLRLDNQISLGAEVEDIVNEFSIFLGYIREKLGEDFSSDELLPFLIASVNDIDNDPEIFNDQLLENFTNLASLNCSYMEALNNRNVKIKTMQGNQLEFFFMPFASSLPSKVLETNAKVKYLKELNNLKDLSETSQQQNEIKTLSDHLQGWLDSIANLDAHYKMAASEFTKLILNNNLDDINSIKSAALRVIFKEHNIRVPIYKVNFSRIEDAKEAYRLLSEKLLAEGKTALATTAENVYNSIINSPYVDVYNTPAFLDLFKDQEGNQPVTLRADQAKFTDLKVFKATYKNLREEILTKKSNTNHDANNKFSDLHDAAEEVLRLPTMVEAENIIELSQNTYSNAGIFFETIYNNQASLTARLGANPLSYFQNNFSPYFIEDLGETLTSNFNHHNPMETVNQFFDKKLIELPQINQVRIFDAACDDCIEQLKVALLKEAIKQNLLEPFALNIDKRVTLEEFQSLRLEKIDELVAQPILDQVNPLEALEIIEPNQENSEIQRRIPKKTLKSLYDLDAFYKALDPIGPPSADALFIQQNAPDNFKVQIKSYRATLRLKERLATPGSANTKLTNFVNLYNNDVLRSDLTKNTDPAIIRFMNTIGSILFRVMTFGLFGKPLKTQGQELDQKIKREIRSNRAPRAP